MSRVRVLILGAAGRDFHNFNCAFRNDPDTEVVGFTATQIPGIAGRRYPAEMSGPLYPEGIPIFNEEDLDSLIEEHRIDHVILAYSDLSHMDVMHIASRALAAGADFRLMGPTRTMLPSKAKVIAVCAVRTGCGKSQTTRYISHTLREMGLKVVAIRHPMPYGDLSRQRVERLATYEDLDTHKCTIEEREEYEAHIDEGIVVFAGVDYGEILKEAEKEADVIIWDGGNNDLPFIKPDLWITLADPLRPGHELSYYPGETNFRMADIIVLNKANTAGAESVRQVKAAARKANPDAEVILASSEVSVDDPDAIRGKRVLIVEDGPTLTHGGMPFGAGQVAADRFGAAEVVDPMDYAVGSIKECYRKYPNIGRLVPAMGYYPDQIQELEETVQNVDADLVLVATPIDLARIIKVDKPAMRVRYALEDMSEPTLAQLVRDFVGKD